MPILRTPPLGLPKPLAQHFPPTTNLEAGGSAANEWSDDEDTPPPGGSPAGLDQSPMRGVGNSLLSGGAGLAFHSPGKGKQRAEYPQQLRATSIADAVAAPCFAALSARIKGAPRRLRAALLWPEPTDKENPDHALRTRSPRRELTASPVLHRLRHLGTLAAERTLERSSATFFKKLLHQWILYDHPTQGCLNFLQFSDSAAITSFVTDYTDLRFQRDEILEEIVGKEREHLEGTYGTFFTSQIHRHTFPFLQAHRTQALKRALTMHFKKHPGWEETVAGIPTILFSAIERLDLSSITKNHKDPGLPSIIARLKEEISQGSSDAHKLLCLHLDETNPKLLVKLMRNTSPVGSINPIRLRFLVLKTVTIHFMAHSPLMHRLSGAFDSIDTAPLVAAITHTVHPEMRLSPSLQTLLDEHLKHTFERFRLLPRLYAIHANTLALLSPFVPAERREALREALVGISKLGSDRRLASQRYRKTQGHATVPRETKLKMKWFAHGVYIETGATPPERACLAEGAHTLPNPGAFSPNSRHVARILNKHEFPIIQAAGGREESEEEEAVRVERHSPLLIPLKKLIDQYKERLIDEQQLLQAFESAFTQLYTQDEEHFVWNAYWLIAEVFLHAFSETQYFPLFVNHEHDTWSENKNLLALALQQLIAEALDPEREGAPLTYEDANRALSPLVRETLARCDKKTREYYAEYKETGTLFPLIKAWMGLHVAGTVPRMDMSAEAGGGGDGGAPA